MPANDVLEAAGFHPDVLEAAGLPYGEHACLPCLSERLGRSLSLKDFTPSSTNEWVRQLSSGELPTKWDGRLYVQDDGGVWHAGLVTGGGGDNGFSVAFEADRGQVYQIAKLVSMSG